jgi:hypothetical protein
LGFVVGGLGAARFLAQALFEGQVSAVAGDEGEDLEACVGRLEQRSELQGRFGGRLGRLLGPAESRLPQTVFQVQQRINLLLQLALGRPRACVALFHPNTAIS